MSVKVMSAVFDRYPHGGGEMLLALALADHASDDGTRVFPSVKALSEKTRQSERIVQYQLRRMEDLGWLVLVGAGNGGRSMSREYRISLDWIKGADIAPFQKGANDDIKGATDDIKGANGGTKGCNPRQERVQPIAPANNHHGIINEPSLNRLSTGAAEATKKTSKATSSAFPENFEPDAAAQAIASDLGLQLAHEVAAFADHHAAKDSRFADWQAALRTWLRNSAKFAQRSHSAGHRSPSAETPYQRSMRERVASLSPSIARRAPGERGLTVIEPFDVEVKNVVAIASR